MSLCKWHTFWMVPWLICCFIVILSYTEIKWVLMRNWGTILPWVKTVWKICCQTIWGMWTSIYVYNDAAFCVCIKQSHRWSIERSNPLLQCLILINSYSLSFESNDEWYDHIQKTWNFDLWKYSNNSNNFDAKTFHMY